MEVHHHPDLHHRKKKITEYFLEFLMIFLAVTMGFFAESLREDISDGNKEKQFMQSLLADIQNDSTELSNKEKEFGAFPDALKNLATACNQSLLSDSVQQLMYTLNVKYLGTTQLYFTDKTATQLKNSGGMRLIKSKQVADAIALYWQGIDDLKFTFGNYENYRRPIRQLSFRIFNYTNYKRADKTNVEFTNGHPQLTLKDPILLKEFGSGVWLLGSNITNFYFPAIIKQKNMAGNLMNLIKEEYNL
jgi:hypothetical protein